MSANARSGFTLVEMLVVMATLGVALFVGGALIVTTMKADRLGHTTSDRVSQRMELARQFRDDVARAETAPDKFADDIAGPQRLILRMPGGAAVVYECENNALHRSEWVNQKEKRRAIPLGAGATVEFVRPSTKGGLVTLRLTDRTGKGPAKQSELSAALGGNLR